MILERILDLTEYGLATGLIEQADKQFTINRLLELFRLDEMEEDVLAAHKGGMSREEAEASLEEILKDMRNETCMFGQSTGRAGNFKTGI